MPPRRTVACGGGVRYRTHTRAEMAALYGLRIAALRCDHESGGLSYGMEDVWVRTELNQGER